MAIPKKIHYCWFGHNPLPRSAERCIASWKRFCPDYEIILWNEDNFDFQRNTYAQEAYQQKKWAFVTDYARLKILYDYGGIYLDTDVELVRPLDPFLKGKGFMGFEAPTQIATGLGCGAEAGSPIIKALLDDYAELHFALPDGSLDLLPCPKRNMATLMTLGVQPDGQLQQIDGFCFYPRDYLAPMDPGTGQMLYRTANTVSIHHYDASWETDEFRFKKKIWRHFGKTSLLSRGLLKISLPVWRRLHKG